MSNFHGIETEIRWRGELIVDDVLDTVLVFSIIIFGVYLKFHILN